MLVSYLYILNYTDFSLVTKLRHEVNGVMGSVFDEGRSRLFAYCRFGTVYVWNISGINFTVETIMKEYLSYYIINSIVLWPEKNLILYIGVSKHIFTSFI